MRLKYVKVTKTSRGCLFLKKSVFGPLVFFLVCMVKTSVFLCFLKSFCDLTGINLVHWTSMCL